MSPLTYHFQPSLGFHHTHFITRMPFATHFDLSSHPFCHQRTILNPFLALLFSTHLEPIGHPFCRSDTTSNPFPPFTMPILSFKYHFQSIWGFHRTHFVVPMPFPTVMEIDFCPLILKSESLKMHWSTTPSPNPSDNYPECLTSLYSIKIPRIKQCDAQNLLHFSFCLCVPYNYVFNTVIARALFLAAGSPNWASTHHTPRQGLAAATRPHARADTHQGGMHSHQCTCNVK